MYALVRRYAEYTSSPRASRLLAFWDETVPRFVKIYPNDYRRVIETQKKFRKSGMSEDEVIMLAFEQNAGDAARVGGN